MCHSGVNVIIKRKELAWLEALLSVQPELVVGARLSTMVNDRHWVQVPLKSAIQEKRLSL